LPSPVWKPPGFYHFRIEDPRPCKTGNDTERLDHPRSEVSLRVSPALPLLCLTHSVFQKPMLCSQWAWTLSTLPRGKTGHFPTNFATNRCLQPFRCKNLAFRQHSYFLGPNHTHSLLHGPSPQAWSLMHALFDHTAAIMTTDHIIWLYSVCLWNHCFNC
jgi:hypothetical protein